MTRDCARVIDDEYCGRPMFATREATITTAATTPADLAYIIDLCQEHTLEYDREAL